MLHLDANRAEIDVYNMGWTAYLAQRETDERRRKRERANAERKANTLIDQANKMRAKATKAQAAQSMLKRAEKLMAGVEGERRADRVARIKFPAPAPCGKTPLTAAELSKSYGSLEVFTDVDLAIDRGSRVVILGLNGAGKTTLLRILAGDRRARHRPGDARARPQARLLRPGARDARHQPHRAGEPAAPAPQLTDTEARVGARARSCSPATTPHKPAGCPLRRREDPAGAGHPGGLERQRAAARRADQQPRPRLPRGGARRDPPYEGAIVLVTHDEGAVHALEPDRVLILPDGVEDLWTDGLRRPRGAGVIRSAERSGPPEGCSLGACVRAPLTEE